MSSTPPVDFGLLLNLAFGAFKDALHHDLAQGGFADIGSSFGYVLRLLDDVPHSLSELATRLEMTPPGALKVVEDMVAKGYVSRVDDAQDKRVKRLHLTPRGRALLARAHDFHVRYEQALGAQLGTRRVAAARQVLECMAAAAGSSSGRSARPL